MKLKVLPCCAKLLELHHHNQCWLLTSKVVWHITLEQFHTEQYSFPVLPFADRLNSKLPVMTLKKTLNCLYTYKNIFSYSFIALTIKFFFFNCWGRSYQLWCLASIIVLVLFCIRSLTIILSKWVSCLPELKANTLHAATWKLYLFGNSFLGGEISFNWPWLRDLINSCPEGIILLGIR